PAPARLGSEPTDRPALVLPAAAPIRRMEHPGRALKPEPGPSRHSRHNAHHTPRIDTKSRLRADGWKGRSDGQPRVVFDALGVLENHEGRAAKLVVEAGLHYLPRYPPLAENLGRPSRYESALVQGTD